MASALTPHHLGHQVRDPRGQTTVQLDADPAPAGGPGQSADHPQGTAGEADCESVLRTLPYRALLAVLLPSTKLFGAKCGCKFSLNVV